MMYLIINYYFNELIKNLIQLQVKVPNIKISHEIDFYIYLFIKFLFYNLFYILILTVFLLYRFLFHNKNNVRLLNEIKIDSYKFYCLLFIFSLLISYDIKIFIIVFYILLIEYNLFLFIFSTILQQKLNEESRIRTYDE